MYRSLCSRCKAMKVHKSECTIVTAVKVHVNVKSLN